MADGQQIGPISGDDLQQLAINGIIHAESELWTEGLDQWIPATHVEGLLPAEPQTALTEEVPVQAVPVQAVPAQAGSPHLVVGAAAPAAHPLAGEIVPQAPQAGQAVGVQPVGVQPVGVQPIGVQPVGMPMAGAVAPGMDYPPTGIKRASYGLLIGLWIGALVVGIVGLGLSASTASRGPDGESTSVMILFGSLGIAQILALMAGILTYIYLYRAWSCLRFGSPRTTAGKAIGFLFIPFFNIYWIFVAVYGLAQDWNRITTSHPNLQGAPRMSEGLFLTFLICSFVVFPVGIIFWFIVYKQICDGINFMATQNLRQQQPASMSFY